jgi:hypothetical protein
MIKKIMVIPALFYLFLTCLFGCTAPLALQGLSSGTPVAFNSTGRGKGDSAWFARYDDVVQATLNAGQKLSFKLEKKEIGKDQSAFYFLDDKGNKLEILIERRTENLTWARLNVGWFGSASIGRLMARQIVFEMAEAGKFLRDWHPAEDD